MNRLSKQKSPFTQVPNALLTDPNLSMKAKGLYAIMYAKPDGWTFYEGALVKESRDGAEAVSTGLRELVEAGWLRRERMKNAQGQFAAYEYEILVDQRRFPAPGKPPRENRGGKPPPNNTDGSKTEKSPPNPQGGERDESHSEGFKAVCAAYRKASPSRADEDAAWRVWREKGCEKDAADILRAVPELAKTERWRADDGRWVPNLSKFLRDAQWKGVAPADGPTEEERRATSAARRKAFEDAVAADRKARGLYV